MISGSYFTRKPEEFKYMKNSFLLTISVLVFLLYFASVICYKNRIRVVLRGKGEKWISFLL